MKRQEICEKIRRGIREIAEDMHRARELEEEEEELLSEKERVEPVMSDGLIQKLSHILSGLVVLAGVFFTAFALSALRIAEKNISSIEVLSTSWLAVNAHAETALATVRTAEKIAYPMGIICLLLMIGFLTSVFTRLLEIINMLLTGRKQRRQDEAKMRAEWPEEACPVPITDGEDDPFGL